MNSNGWDGLIDLSEISIEKMVQNIWVNPKVQNKINSVPHSFEETVPITDKMSLHVKLSISQSTLSDYNNAPVHIKLTAKTDSELRYRIHIPFQVDALVELLFKGDLGNYLKSGDYIS